MPTKLKPTIKLLTNTVVLNNYLFIASIYLVPLEGLVWSKVIYNPGRQL